MTKKYFIELAEYNTWANEIVQSWFDQLTVEQWGQPIVSSFKSLAETTVHTAGAERIWLDRLNEVENPVFLSSVFKGSKQEAIDIWKKTSAGLKSFIENFDETKMEDMVSFKRPDGKTYQLQYYQVFAHVFNHTTYHRGQMVTLLRQVGFTAVHSIDLSTFFWSKKPVPKLV